MSTLPTILLTIAGAVLILMALRDVFDVLFHETGRGVLSHVVTRAVWRVFRAMAAGRPRLFSLAGPFALLAVVLSWGLLLIAGWALVYWPHMPSDFTLGSGVDPGLPFIDSLYMSMVTLSTVGFGDIAPSTTALRVLTPVEALLGFGLLTASISWLLSIYPVLSRRRSLAYEVNLLAASEKSTGITIRQLEPEAAESVYSELTSRLVSVERDLAALPVAYYFAATDERFSLPATLPTLLDLARRGTEDSLPERVRLRATMLRGAIDDFAQTAQSIHRLPGETTDALLDAYARDHRR